MQMYKISCAAEPITLGQSPAVLRHGNCCSCSLSCRNLNGLEVKCFRREESVKRREGNELEKIYPFWEKHCKSYPQRLLSRRIVDLTKRRQLNQIFQELETARTKNIHPNRVVMNSVMAACVHCGDVDRAILIYQEMVQFCGVDNVTYTILLKGLGEASRLDAAFEVVESIEKGTAPGRPTLTEVHIRTLLNAFADAGDILRACGILVRYRSLINRMGPSILTYNILIKGYAKSDTPLEALRLKDDMIKHGTQPERLTFNSLIQACIKGQDMDKALKLLMEMKEDAERLKLSTLLPNIVTYTTIIKGLGESGDLDGVLRMVDEIKMSATCTFDRVAYGVIIDACIAAGSPTAGLAFWHEMVNAAKGNRELRPKAHTFLSLMRAFAETGDTETVKLLHECMVPESTGPISVEARVEADELWIEAAINAGQLNIARHLLQNMVALKKGLPLSKRGHLAIVRFEVLTEFGDALFSPFVFQIALEDPVEKFMLTCKEMKPLYGGLHLSGVIMRFFRDEIVPIIDDSGKCIGAVHCEDCSEINTTLSNLVRGPLPTVTKSTPLSNAFNLLLEPQNKILAVCDSNAGYSFARHQNEQVIGFLTRQKMYSYVHHSYYKVD